VVRFNSFLKNLRVLHEGLVLILQGVCCECKSLEGLLVCAHVNHGMLHASLWLSRWRVWEEHRRAKNLTI